MPVVLEIIPATWPPLYEFGCRHGLLVDFLIYWTVIPLWKSERRSFDGLKTDNAY
jgi:hypothetical protein